MGSAKPVAKCYSRVDTRCALSEKLRIKFDAATAKKYKYVMNMNLSEIERPFEMLMCLICCEVLSSNAFSTEIFKHR